MIRKEVEDLVKKYYIENNIPLKLKTGVCTIIMSVYGAKVAGCATSTPSNFAKKWLPEKPPKVRIFTYILSLYNKKSCSFCKQIFNIEEFRYKQTECKYCEKVRSDKWNKSDKKKVTQKKYKQKTRKLQNYYEAKRRVAKLHRTVSWDQEGIREFYENCPKGNHVDHIIPLQGKNISGLHVLSNLQYLTEQDNLRKGNRWGIDST